MVSLHQCWFNIWGFPHVSDSKESLWMQEAWVRALDRKDALEKGMAAHSGILVWRILWTEEPGGLQSMVSHRVGHDWVTNTFTLFSKKWIPWHVCTHSSVLAWRIPGMGEPGGLPSLGSHRVRHDWSDLAAAAATACVWLLNNITNLTPNQQKHWVQLII